MDRGVQVLVGNYYHQVDRPSEVASSSPALRFPASGVASPGDGSVGGGGMNYIEHPVSQMDTLAGVAIRYGVEVTDIKRINGLVTDFQMFALKTLQIPLPGRGIHHLPPFQMVLIHKGCSAANCKNSFGRASGLEKPPPNPDLFDSIQSLRLKTSPRGKLSTAMGSLQSYYGLKLADQEVVSKSFEMTVYREGGSHSLENGQFNKLSPLSNPPLNLHRKCRSVAYMNMVDDASTQEHNDNDSDRWTEKLIRRRQKSESDFLRTPEMLLKEDNSSGGFLAIAGKETQGSYSNHC